MRFCPSTNCDRGARGYMTRITPMQTDRQTRQTRHDRHVPWLFGVLRRRRQSRLVQWQDLERKRRAAPRMTRINRRRKHRPDRCRLLEFASACGGSLQQEHQKWRLESRHSEHYDSYSCGMFDQLHRASLC